MDYRIIDTHCHPQFPQYDSDRNEVIARALHKGIGMVCVGTDLAISRQAIELAQQYEGLWTSVGLHPNDELDGAYDERVFASMAAQKKVVAIGEIGLDFYRTPEPERRDVQRSRFILQLALARSLSKPVIIHCRDAHDDMMQILRSEREGIAGVIHSFNGSVTQARTYLDDGFYIGLNAIVSYSDGYLEMLRYIPLDRMLLETDAPYLAPEPYRGRRNEPLYIEAVGNYIAEKRGISSNALFSATTNNAKVLLSIKEQ